MRRGMFPDLTTIAVTTVIITIFISFGILTFSLPNDDPVIIDNSGEQIIDVSCTQQNPIQTNTGTIEDPYECIGGCYVDTGTKVRRVYS